MHCVRWLADALLRQARLDGDEVERAMFRLANWQDGLGTRPHLPKPSPSHETR